VFGSNRSKQEAASSEQQAAPHYRLPAAAFKRGHAMGRRVFLIGGVARVESCTLFNNLEGKACMNLMRVRARIGLSCIARTREHKRLVGGSKRKHAMTMYSVEVLTGRKVMGSSD
jgi:hypothetical protein